MTQAKDVRFGLIGCGVISPQHLESIQMLDGARLVAVCDNKPERAQKAAEKYGVEWHENYKDLIKRDDIDVVAICTPHGLHVPMGIDALSLGKHIVMEKPLGLNVAEVDRMIEVAKKHDKKIFPVLQVRYNPAVQALRQAMEEGKLGKTHHTSLVMRWFRPQAYYDKSDWHGTKAQEGGFLLSQGIHYVDMMRYLFGPVRSVYAHTDTVAHDIEIEDHVAAVVKFENGTYATMEMSLATYPRNLECSITVLGSKGTVKVSGAALNEIEYWEVEDTPKPDVAAGLAPNVYKGGMYQGSCPNHIYIYQDLLRHLENPDHPRIDEFEARNALEFAEAIYTSSDVGKEVVFDRIAGVKSTYAIS